MSKSPRTFACPKCNRTLRASGEMTVNLPDDSTVTVPTFQCDECEMTVDLGQGQTMDVALTFAVGTDGQAFDPAAPDGRLRF